MTARIATEADIPELVGMGRRFHEMAPHKPVGAYDGDAVARTMAFLIDNPNGLLVRSDTGMLGGFMAPVFFSPSVPMMEESFWWANGGGQALREVFEDEAKKMGARFVLFSTLENDRSASIDRVMRRSGYTPVERRYLKEIN